MTGRRPPSWLTLWLAGAIGLLCGVVLVVAVRGVVHDRTHTFTHTVTRVAQPMVPDVTGASLDDARAALDDAGYESDVVSGGGTFGPIVDSNWVVVAQEPTAGAALARGATVRLGIARG